MPELPEVETIKRILEPQLIGREITNVKVQNSQVIAYPEETVFIELLQGQKVQKLSRRGKFLAIHLKNGDSLVLHLRMTGQVLVTPQNYPMEKHTHLIIGLSDGKQLRYIDVRRFGRFWYLRKDEIDNKTGRSKLGVEPFDKNLTGDYLKKRIGHKKKAIKEILHDQSVIAGIGNIYSDEILFVAGIYPATKCTEISDDKWDLLAEKIHEIISWGIETNAMSPEEYLVGKGKEYRNTPSLRVYGRAGQKCVTCGSVLEKMVVGGRSSSYCPKCQKNSKLLPLG